MKTERLTKIRDLIQREKAPRFEKTIDLFSIERGLITGVSGALGLGFKVFGRDLLLESDSFIEDFERRMRKILNQLPEKLTLHFIVKQEFGDPKVIEEFRGDKNLSDPIAKELVEAKMEFFRKNLFLRREVYLFVQSESLFKRRNSIFPVLNKFELRERRKGEFFETEMSLLQIGKNLKDGFRDLGIYLEKMTDGEIVRYLLEVLNPSASMVFKELPPQFVKQSESYPEDETLRSRLLLSRPQSELSYFYQDQYFHKAINLRLLPDYSDIKILKDFLQSLGPEFLVSIRIEVPDQDREKAILRRISNFHKAEGIFSKSGRHEAEKKHEESEDFLKVLAESLDKLFYLSLVVIVKDKELETCNKKANDALNTFKRLGDSVGLIDDMNHDRLFLSALPLQGAENPLQFLVRTSVLPHFMPLQVSWPGTEKAGILVKSYSGLPVKLDLFDSSLQAKHALMLGTTGSGKSFFTNQLILYFMTASSKRDVIVIDVGGSYRKLVKVLGGEYLEVECSEYYAINPFPQRRSLFPNGKDAEPDYLQFIKEILERMVSPRKALPASEKIILEIGILEIYRSLKEDEAPLLQNLQALLKAWPHGDDEDKRKAYRFSKELTLFTEGEYGKILNRPSRFNIASRFCVFDLRKISQYPELQEILLLVIPFTLRRKFEDIGREKLIVLDECWQLLKESGGRDLVEVFYRTSRKYNAGVLSISQNPEDFFASSISGAMINNSSVKYILKLGKGHEDLFRFGFNENEIEACRELEVRPGHFSECFIKFAERGVLVRYEPNPLEYWISTTDPHDRHAEFEFKEALKDKSLTELEVLKELAVRYPNGVNKGTENLCAA